MTISEIYNLAGVTRLPVDPIAIAGALSIKVIDYNTAAEFFGTDVRELYNIVPLGFSFKENGCLCIALNGNSCGARRRRFTAAHELAHCVLGHLDALPLSRVQEYDADCFAAELLAPLAVLSAYCVRSPKEIARVCGITESAAAVRARQLEQRERRGFTLSDDELKVLEIMGYQRLEVRG